MSFDVRFHPLAADDLDRIDAWIFERSPSAAEALLARVAEFCTLLATFPDQGRLRPAWGRDVRSMTIDRRLLVAYRLEGETVVLLRLFYAGQDADAAMTPEGEP